MKAKKKQIAWTVTIVVAAAVGFAAAQALGQVTKLRHRGLETCRAFFEAEIGSTVEAGDVVFTHKKTVFPTPLDKRFRAHCTYGETTVVMEAKPFEDWIIISTIGLD